MHRQKTALRRAGTRKINLTKGNFVADYAVPTAVRNAVESKWANTTSNEFTCVIPSISLMHTVLTSREQTHALHRGDLRPG